MASANTTVYFLGAGASKAFYPCLPLASELTVESLAETQDYLCGFPPPQEILSAFQTLLGSSKELQGVKRERLEDALEFLQSRANPNMEKLLLFCLLYRLNLSAQNESFGPPSGLKSWVKAAREEGHPVITTNYDQVIERAVVDLGVGDIWQAGADLLDCAVPSAVCTKPPTPLRTTAEKKLNLLKLHGSAGWTVCGNCHKYNLHPIHAFGASDALAGPIKCPNCMSEQDCKPVIIPPKKSKAMAIADGAFASIWARAREALQTADTIVFSGFSLSEDDSHIREVLSAALNVQRPRSVVVVDKACSYIRKRYEAIYGRAIEFRTQSWAEYLEDQASDTARLPGRA